MKFSLFALATVLASANAISKPSLSVGIKDGKFDGVDGMDPTLKWSDSASSGDLDVVYGIEAAARPTTDLASLPRKIFGTLKTKQIAGWGISTSASQDLENGGTDITVTADNEDADLSVVVVASAADGVESITATKNIDLDGSSLTITPSYTVATEEADVVVAYDNGSTNVELTASADSQEVVVTHDMGDTNVKLTASKDGQELVVDHTMDNTNIVLTASADDQEVTITQQLDDDNKISPTINRNGDISVVWERSLGDDNSLTATLVPDDSVSLEWKDDNWTANIDAELSGTDIGDVSISAKRDVEF